MIRILEDKKSELEEIVKNNDTYKKIKSTVGKYEGFTLYSAYRKGDYVNITIQRKSKLAPPVYYDEVFSIGTVSVGSLKLDDYEKFLKYCTEAYDMCRELEQIDVMGLPDMSDK